MPHLLCASIEIEAEVERYRCSTSPTRPDCQAFAQRVRHVRVARTSQTQLLHSAYWIERQYYFEVVVAKHRQRRPFDFTPTSLH